MKENDVVFVTGGTGLIGAHALYELATRGASIRAMRRKSSKVENVRKVFGYYSDQADELFDRIEWVYGDLHEPDSLKVALQGVRHVYHSAALVSFDPRDEALIRQANIQGTAAIVGQCLNTGVEKLCYVSSAAALGKPAGKEEGMIDETTPWDDSDDLSDYAWSKFEAEAEVWKGIRRGLEAVIVNPTIVLGPGDWDRSSARIVKTIWKGFPFYSTGVNSFVDVRDVARAMVELTNSPIRNERFVVTSENWPFKKLFHTIADHLGKRRPPVKVTKELGEIAWRAGALVGNLTGKPPAITRAALISARKHYYFSNAKIREHLSFEFIPVEDSIRDTCRIFLEEHSE